MEQAGCQTTMAASCSVKEGGRGLSGSFRLAAKGLVLTLQGAIRKGGIIEDRLGQNPA